MTNENYERYQHYLNEFENRKREIKTAILDNQSAQRQLEADFCQQTVLGKSTARLRDRIGESQSELGFLELELRAFEETTPQERYKEDLHDAYEEQNKNLSECHRLFDALKPEFDALREQWLNLVARAGEIHRQSQIFQSRIQNLIGMKRYHAPVGDRNQSQFIYLDPKIITEIFEHGRKP